ncbi:hypothetical protein BKA93DRAFT_737738 [Sparassis latifolia]
MPQAQQIQAFGPQYAGPVLRAPSPSSSIESADHQDETSLSDSELSPYDFAMKWDKKIRLNDPRPDEEAANKEPLLLPRPKTAAEEKLLHERVMINLREQVRLLEDESLFEQTVLRGSKVGLEQQPSTNDIDEIMHSLMSPSTSIGSAAIIQRAGSSGTALSIGNARTRSQDTAGGNGTDSSGTTVDKRPTKGKGKAR